MKDIYNDRTYLDKNPTWHEEDAPFKASKIIKLLERNSIPFKTVSEIGCGSGEILVQLESQLQFVTNFFGFDISKDAINIAKKKETDKVKFDIKDISDKSENCFYDLQLVIDVIEHLDNYFSFLSGIVSKSKYTIFHIPLDMCVWTLFREKMLIESKDRVGHIHNFTEDFIINILSDFGFEILDKIYTEPKFKVISTKQKFVNFIRRIIFKINKRFCTKTLGGYSILILTKNNA
ncbi:MAG: class I SAM-dependent methyltransferase [Bacteroidales bacterium]|jgi:predicted TPR repeat methyltransferase|nr:class I SAM-dependent methyltransferase [Bacteroidales bacterium]